MRLAAGVIIVNEDDKILLVQRGHEPQVGRWSLPSGRAEPGESAAEAAVREAREETGLEVEIVREALHVRLPTGDGDEFDVHDFIATVVGGTLQRGDDAADVRWFDLAELADWPLTTGLIDYLRQAGLDIS